MWRCAPKGSLWGPERGPADGVRQTSGQLALAATRELAVMRCPEEGLSGGDASTLPIL